MLAWNQINTVFLDMDGTLLDLAFDSYFWQQLVPKHYAKANQLSQQQADSKLTGFYNSCRGSLDWYCLDSWSERLKLDIVKLKQQIQHKVSLRPQTLEFLHFCQQQDLHLCLLTNAHPESLRIKFEQIPLAHYFDRLITAHEIGYAKEQQAFWPALQQFCPFDAASTLFIDDSHNVLDAARDYGITSLYSIAQPDSALAPRTQAPYPMLNQFSDIMA